nr:putative zinc finger, CCHC-type [Tanacetum cinerariifolium]
MAMSSMTFSFVYLDPSVVLTICLKCTLHINQVIHSNTRGLCLFDGKDSMYWHGVEAELVVTEAYFEPIFKKITGEGQMSSEGDKWAKQRKTSDPRLPPKGYANCEAFKEVVEEAQCFFWKPPQVMDVEDVKEWHNLSFFSKVKSPIVSTISSGRSKTGIVGVVLEEDPSSSWEATENTRSGTKNKGLNHNGEGCLVRNSVWEEAQETPKSKSLSSESVLESSSDEKSRSCDSVLCTIAYSDFSSDYEPSDSVLCTIAYLDCSSDDDSDTYSLERDSDFRVHMINPIPHVLPIQEDPPLPLAKIYLLMDAYVKPISVIAFFDTEKKIDFGVTTIQFLGMKITDGKYQPQPHVAQELLKFSDELSSQKMIQQFLGQTEVVKAIKSLAEKMPPLKIHASSKKRILQTDASDECWGAVLLVQDNNNKRHVCRYKSGTLKASEQHYHSTFKEILVVKQGIKKFQFHLIGHEFQVEMDMTFFPRMLQFKRKMIPQEEGSSSNTTPTIPVFDLPEEIVETIRELTFEKELNYATKRFLLSSSKTMDCASKAQTRWLTTTEKGTCVLVMFRRLGSFLPPKAVNYDGSVVYHASYCFIYDWYKVNPSSRSGQWVYDNFDYCEVETSDNDDDARSLVSLDDDEHFNPFEDDPTHPDARWTLKAQIQIGGTPQVNTFQATFYYQMAYQVQNHSLDILVPRQDNTGNALLIEVDANATPTLQYYTIDIVIKRFLTRLQGRLRDCPWEHTSYAREEFLKMKCCSFQKKDLKKHYDRTSQRFYCLNRVDDVNLKQVFLNSFPESLANKAYRALEARNVTIAQTTLGELYQLILNALAKLCSQKKFLVEFERTRKCLGTTCGDKYLQIKYDKPSDSVLCMISYSDFSSDDDSDTDSIKSDFDFGVHMINPIPHILPIQEDLPLPLAKIHLLTDAYAKHIPVIAFFNTGSFLPPKAVNDDGSVVYHAPYYFIHDWYKVNPSSRRCERKLQTLYIDTRSLMARANGVDPDKIPYYVMWNISIWSKDHLKAYKWIEANGQWLYDNFYHCEVETSDDDDDARSLWSSDDDEHFDPFKDGPTHPDACWSP